MACKAKACTLSRSTTAADSSTGRFQIQVLVLFIQRPGAYSVVDYDFTGAES
jgi:hypothetical protein